MVKYILAVFLLAFASKVTCQNYLGVLTKTACEGNNLTLECSAGYILDVNIANYGRTASGYFVCPKYTQDQNILCFSSNATSYMRQKCNDRGTCTVPASSSIFGNPCPQTYKYLQATYSCSQYQRACENTTLTITCPIGRSIIITSANYGRTIPESEFSCPSNMTSADNTNCRAANSTAIVANACNYKNSCSVLASNSKFGNPCPGTCKYLQATYLCL